LPENHACPEYLRARAPREEGPPTIIEREPKRAPYEYVVPYVPRPATKVFWFSPIELKHLALSIFLVMGVGLSILLQIPGLRHSAREAPEILISLAIVFTSVFLLHELAHKLLAQHYGLWAEFRLTMFGALITLLSIVSPLKIISPGAVMISGPMSKETFGKTALAGPLTNITLSIISVIFMLYPPSSFVQIIAMLGAAFNAWIALFNLIPFGMMDGLKVLLWNKMVWSMAFIISVILTIFTLTHIFA